PLRGVVLESCRRPGDAVKHLLGQVGRVGILQPAPPAVGVDQRGVDADELAPRQAILRIANAEKQTGTSRTGSAHDRSGSGRGAANPPPARRLDRCRSPKATVAGQATGKHALPKIAWGALHAAPARVSEDSGSSPGPGPRAGRGSAPPSRRTRTREVL